jgi:hypothetical protein
MKLLNRTFSVFVKMSDDYQELTKEKTLERITQKFALLRAKENAIDRGTHSPPPSPPPSSRSLSHALSSSPALRN